MAKGKPRSQASREQASRTLIRTTAERSRKARGYDVLLQLVRDGIACGGSTRQFLRWVERAKFIIANEPASAPETSADECMTKVRQHFDERRTVETSPVQAVCDRAAHLADVPVKEPGARCPHGFPWTTTSTNAASAVQSSQVEPVT